MDNPAYDEFLRSDDTLQVYADSKLVFSSKKERLVALLEYIDSLSVNHQGVIIWDKVVGNAAALLSIKAGCWELHSPLASRLAVITLDKYGILHHFGNIVSFIRRADGKGMCPMEKLSLDKEPEEFYTAIKAVIAGKQT